MDTKRYLLDLDICIEASSIEEAQTKAEAIIADISQPCESLRSQGVEGPEVTFIGGSLVLGREKEPSEFLRFGSDKPYKNFLAEHPERAHEREETPSAA